MKKILILFLLLIYIPTSIFCSEFYQQGDYFFISRQGAQMPVWVRGNTDSGIYIIANHGGPGDTTVYLGKFHSYQELEKSYAVVYWDQRNSGISQGNAAIESLSPESFATDLHMVVSAVTQKYEPEHLFLYGISWGGTLVLQYAVTENYQKNIDGLIIEGGGHNMPLLMNTSIRNITEFAKKQIANQVNSEYWQQTLDFYAVNSDPSSWGLEQYRKYAEYLRQTNSERHYETLRIPDEYSGPGFEDIFLSPLSLAMFFNPTSLLPNMNILNLDLTSDMANISIPVLLLWGEYDYNSPSLEMAESAVSALSNETYNGLIIKAGHNPAIDNPKEFLLRFNNFISATIGVVK